MFDVYHVGFANGTIGSDNYLVVYDHVGANLVVTIKLRETRAGRSKMEKKKL